MPDDGAVAVINVVGSASAVAVIKMLQVQLSVLFRLKYKYVLKTLSMLPQSELLMLLQLQLFGPRREKTCIWGFRQSEFQNSLLSYRDALENRKFTRSKFTYGTLQKANNKGADQSARMRRLVCVCVVRKPPKTGFLALRPILSMLL